MKHQEVRPDDCISESIQCYHDKVPAAVGIDPGVPEGRPVVRVALEEVAEGCRPVAQG